MPYSQNFWRVSFGGTLFVTEEWSCNICMGAPGGSTDGNPDGAELTAIRTALNAWFIHANSYNSAAAKLGYVKVNEIGVDGHYVNPFATVEYVYPAPAAGATATLAAPQHSVALSWVTSRARGPGAHGRIYPPTGNVTIAADGMIASSNATAMATQAKTLLDALNDVHAGYQVVVASQGGVAGEPALVPVTGVRVGRVADTQRRRRESLVENYVPTLALEPV